MVSSGLPLAIVRGVGEPVGDTSTGRARQTLDCASQPSPEALVIETMTFSESGTAAVYHVYAGTLASLHLGVYDHAATPGLCGITDALPGNGSVTAVAPFPENAYFLAVAANAVGESTYGNSSVGIIPPGGTTCP